MDYRGVLLITTILGAAVYASTACSGPDPGAITFSERPSTSSGEPQGSTSSSSSSGAVDGGGSGPDATVPSDPIFGTAAFTWVDPGIAANNADPAHGGTVEGKDCMVSGCHADGGKVFVFGGTLYDKSGAGAVTIPKGQIKMVGPNATEIGTTYTDANGNFWLDKAGTTIPVGSKVGVRKMGGLSAGLMATGLQTTDGGCNKGGTCHGGQQGHPFPN